jgi:hypothetical protein
MVKVTLRHRVSHAERDVYGQGNREPAQLVILAKYDPVGIGTVAKLFMLKKI